MAGIPSGERNSLATTSPEPCLFAIFGATGDLMHRKLLPALARLAANGKLPAGSQILGVGRSVLNDEGFRAQARKVLELAKTPNASGQDVAQWCDRHLHYRSIKQEEIGSVAKEIEALEREHSLPGNRIFYLALPPEAFEPTVIALGEAGLNHSPGWTRLVVEKPFGRDLASSQELAKVIYKYFDESQIYRIDHYLGKETVQNLLVLRFANPIFENLWNRDRIESVQITVAETLGVERRGAYYEQAGALRDMVQNHLTQLLCLVAMEIPAVFQGESIRNEKEKVLRSIAGIPPQDVVFGQYGTGQLNGQHVAGYREEPGVASNSQVETFVALKVRIENWRWQGVPFYLRVGKRLPRAISQIVIQFRCPPVLMFQSFQECEIHANRLEITLQPDEGFDLSFEMKEPGQELVLETQKLHFRYAEAFAPLADAYETLLLDVMIGDQTLFVRGDSVEDSWRIYTPLLGSVKPSSYAAGTWGPAAADDLLARDKHRWSTL